MTHKNCITLEEYQWNHWVSGYSFQMLPSRNFLNFNSVETKMCIFFNESKSDRRNCSVLQYAEKTENWTAVQKRFQVRGRHFFPPTSVVATRALTTAAWQNSSNFC